MKVICVKKFKSQGLQYELTYGKVYDVILPKQALHFSGDVVYPEPLYKIKNDRGYQEYYNTSYFVSLEEWRENRLIEIGI